jgi:uncharacterized membrane-anchored protein
MQSPSRKWFATQITAIAAWFVALVEANYEFTDTLVIAAVGIVAQALIAYFVPNDEGNPESSVRGQGLVEMVIAVLLVLILVVVLLRLL